MANYNQALYFRQSRGLNFSGANDKYNRDRQMLPFDFPLTEALDGNYPLDVTGVALDESWRDTIMQRLQRYRVGHEFYRGDQYAYPFEDGEPKTVFNFTKVVADRAVDWHCGKGWKIQSVPGNEDIATYLNSVWDYNDKMGITLCQGQFGAVTGDSYIYATARTVDRYGRKIPRNKWTVRLQAINPAFVFPIWSNTETHKMAACFIQMPVYNYGQSNGNTRQLFSIWITPEEITTWLNHDLIEKIPNLIGEVPVVPIPNMEWAGSQFGQSDIEEIIPLNREYNQISQSIKQIIQYHAEPTTIIYGARASDLEKGARAVWSGLPKYTDARVENLTLSDNLEATYKYLDTLKTLISEFSCTPKIVLDSVDIRLGQLPTSGIELLFQPIMDKTRRRHICHAEAVRETNRLILLIEERVIGSDMGGIADDPEAMYHSEISYVSPLPRDDAAFLDLAIKKANAGVWSQAEMIRQTADVPNIGRLVLELLADKRMMLNEAYENQRAAAGERPNSLVTFTGSEALIVEQTNLAKEIASLEKMAGQDTVSTMNGSSKKLKVRLGGFKFKKKSAKKKIIPARMTKVTQAPIGKGKGKVKVKVPK